MSNPAPHERTRNQEATVYVGNLDEKVTDSLVWELMTQAGPVGKSTHLFGRVKARSLETFVLLLLVNGFSNHSS